MLGFEAFTYFHLGFPPFSPSSHPCPAPFTPPPILVPALVSMREEELQLSRLLLASLLAFRPRHLTQLWLLDFHEGYSFIPKK